MKEDTTQSMPRLVTSVLLLVVFTIVTMFTCCIGYQTRILASLSRVLKRPPVRCVTKIALSTESPAQTTNDSSGRKSSAVVKDAAESSSSSKNGAPKGKMDVNPPKVNDTPAIDKLMYIRS